MEVPEETLEQMRAVKVSGSPEPTAITYSVPWIAGPGNPQSLLTAACLLLQSAVDDLEVHMQPFLEAAPKDVTSQVCRGI